MLRKRISILFVLALMAGTTGNWLLAQDRPDLQYWPEFQVEHRLSEKVRWNALVSPRFSEDISRLSTWKLATSTNLEATKHLAFSPFLYYYIRWPEPDRVSRETRLGGEAVVSLGKAAWKFQERMRNIFIASLLSSNLNHMLGH